jgi:enoyl-CoA hydratase/carnithine racemase
MAYEQILTERRDDVMLLTLNRPDRLNAWTSRMSSELADAIVTGNNDPEVGAFVVTGQGRGFCAGADIQDQFQSRLDGAAPSTAEDLPPVRDWVGLVRECKPIVAAVNGPAIGVGLTMILPMDFIVAAESAKLSCRFVKMGITPELASSHFLVQRCGWGHASDLALSGRTILGTEAAQIGLVDEVVADDSVLDRALERARSYAENPDGPLRMIKGLITANAVETDLAAVHRREMEALNTAFKEPAHQEAVQAFLEKRPPVFKR